MGMHSLSQQATEQASPQTESSSEITECGLRVSIVFSDVPKCFKTRLDGPVM